MAFYSDPGDEITKNVLNIRPSFSSDKLRFSPNSCPSSLEGLDFPHQLSRYEISVLAELPV